MAEDDATPIDVDQFFESVRPTAGRNLRIELARSLAIREGADQLTVVNTIQLWTPRSRPSPPPEKWIKYGRVFVDEVGYGPTLRIIAEVLDRLTAEAAAKEPRDE